MPAPAPQLVFPLVTSATATNPFSYTEETTYGVLKTASPAYTAVAIAADVSYHQDNVPLDVRMAGSHLKYSTQTGGHNYTLDIPFHPLNITFMKYGTEVPNYTTPTGTSASSLQFAYKYKQALGTAGLNDAFLLFLGFRPNTTSISVSPQGLVEASMNLIGREVYMTTTANGGMTTPTIPSYASITGPVFTDADAANLPLTINAVTYTADAFTINWNNNTFGKAYLGGQGYIDAALVGGIDITGSFTVPIGQGSTLETLSSSNQAGVVAKYVFKVGTMVLNMTGFTLTAVDESILSQPTAPQSRAFTFSCATASIGTS